MNAKELHAYVGDWPNSISRLCPIPLTRIKVGGFLGRRVNKNITSLLAGLKSPIPRAFEALAAGETPGEGNIRPAADSELYKWIEGAAYATVYNGSQELACELDRIVRLVVAQQKPDGYINTQVPPLERLDMRTQHHLYDLYIAGHFFEAAVAHFRATGQRVLLDSACRWADWFIAQYEAGHPYFAKSGEMEHPEVELALIRLYRVTGIKRYFDFAVALTNMSKVSEKVAELRCGAKKLHVVRCGYLLTARAELYLETGKQEFLEHLEALWNELISTRLYITGGIGYIENIPQLPYDLPQTIHNPHMPYMDIAETCASVAIMMFTWRMHAILGKSRCFDMIETTLYNHFLGALSLDNLGIFYYNPLKLIGNQVGRTDHGGSRYYRTRLPQIHSPACCISNVWRFLAAVPEYLFSVDEKGFFVNLYTSSTIEHLLPNGVFVKLVINTEYPHNGKITIRVFCDQPSSFLLRLRVPGWCMQASLTVSEEEEKQLEGGSYVTIERTWKNEDTVKLVFEMPVRMLFSLPEVQSNTGCVAFARGPLVYCLEQEDTEIPIEQIHIPLHPDEVSRVQVRWRSDILGGVNILHIPVVVSPAPQNKTSSYFEAKGLFSPTNVPFIPFYARANRSRSSGWTTLIPQGPAVRNS